MAYLSLFFSALIAATLLPMGSEALLLYLNAQGEYSTLLLWISATTGNVLGSIINYAIGLLAADHIIKKQKNTSSWQHASDFFRHHGKWSLLLAWLPIIGDPLTLLAGIVQMRFIPFLLLVSIGKGLRYAAIILLTNL